MKSKIDKEKSVINFLISIKDIRILDIVYQRKNGMGKLYNALSNKKEMICRLIKFDRITRYDLENLSKDMEEILYLLKKIN